ncbi:MAG: RecX family transcriptional regulator [Coriobacteriaceae bacterium]|nr:RecX family transcriptional regulator [Coriobacteriaceae bacterium]
MATSKADVIAKLQSMMDAIESSEGSGVFDLGVDAAQSSATGKRPSRKVRGEDELPPDKAAYQRVVDLCGYHEFCQAKMRSRLLREDVPPDIAEKAIAKAVRIGLIDDLRWGEMRASALMRKGMGNSGIVRELKENGIAADKIYGWPTAYEERFGTEHERAMRVLEKNPPKSKNLRGSAYAKLMRKGYSPSIAGEVSSAWFAQYGQRA